MKNEIVTTALSENNSLTIIVRDHDKPEIISTDVETVRTLNISAVEEICNSFDAQPRPLCVVMTRALFADARCAQLKRRALVVMR